MLLVFTRVYSHVVALRLCFCICVLFRFIDWSCLVIRWAVDWKRDMLSIWSCACVDLNWVCVMCVLGDFAELHSWKGNYLFYRFVILHRKPGWQSWSASFYVSRLSVFSSKTLAQSVYTTAFNLMIFGAAQLVVNFCHDDRSGHDGAWTSTSWLAVVLAYDSQLCLFSYG